MISEAQQEQATLHALGLLDADEAAAFERLLGADAETHTLFHEMQEAIARLAWAGDQATQKPSPGLKARVMAEVEQGQRQAADRHDVAGRTVVRREPSWFPWAVAAVFSGCAGALCWLYLQQLREVHDLRGAERTHQRLLASAQAETQRNADPLAQVSLCALEPTPNFKTDQPRAMVLWDVAHRQGKLRVNRLAPPAEGRDYQLWAVEKDRQEPVNAGVFHVNADGTADVLFQPMDSGSQPVAAVAVSLEQAGGSPTNQGPVLLLGKF